MENSKDILKVRLHDGIVGLLYLTSVLLANIFGPEYLLIAVGVAALQIISPVTKFCPVYFILNKLMPNTTPMQNGR
jgi:hypothetical protein